MSSFDHIKKLNELMSTYTASLNRLEMIKKDTEHEENPEVKAAVNVLIQTHLKKARTAMMDVQSEFHRFLTSFDS